jgi:hypothetical protein
MNRPRNMLGLLAVAAYGLLITVLLASAVRLGSAADLGHVSDGGLMGYHASVSIPTPTATP